MVQSRMNKHDAFQSTLPAWGETEALRRTDPAGWVISIHSPRMGRDEFGKTFAQAKKISIHSPRMGRDASPRPEGGGGKYFNPLSPHGERRNSSGCSRRNCHFNPLSPHGERQCRRRKLRRRRNFNPLSPHGERRSAAAQIPVSNKFQSTLPAWGETACSSGSSAYLSQFQSTLPAWGETTSTVRMMCTGCYFNPLSPHGERLGRLQLSYAVPDFNPLSPHGERLSLRLPKAASTSFQSTLPAWGETQCPHDRPHPQKISIHSPRMGRDATWRERSTTKTNFNPLSPHGERQQTHTTFRREKLAHLHNIVSFRQQRGSSC